jgi:aryl-alcohol dehydrogenase-like predicted oxidoreductase
VADEQDMYFPFSLIETGFIVAVTAPTVGMNSEERIKEMAEAVNIKLTPEEMKYLEEAYATLPVPDILN